MCLKFHQAGSAWRHYQKPWMIRDKTTLQSFWIIPNILSNWTYFGFSQIRKILPGSDGEFTEQPLACYATKRYTDIDENQTPSLHPVSIKGERGRLGIARMHQYKNSRIILNRTNKKLITAANNSNVNRRTNSKTRKSRPQKWKKKNVCRRFRSHLEAVDKANGDFFE